MSKELIIANSVNQAVMLKNNSSMFIGGGTEINRLGSSVDAETLISIRNLGFDKIEAKKTLKIGARCTFQQIVDCITVPNSIRKACMFMASRTKRNMATIGGNIALLRDDSYLIPTLVASDAKLELQNNDSSVFETNLIDYIEKNNDFKNCLIRTVIIPEYRDLDVASRRCSNTVLSHAYITAAVRYVNKSYKIFVGMKGSGFARFDEIADAMTKKHRVSSDEVLAFINESNEIHFIDDIYGSVEYKKYILAVTVYELYSELRGAAI